MQSLSTLAILSNLPQVLEFVDKNLESLGCSASIQWQLDVAVEEIFEYRQLCLWAGNWSHSGTL